MNTPTAPESSSCKEVCETVASWQVFHVQRLTNAHTRKAPQNSQNLQELAKPSRTRKACKGKGFRFRFYGLRVWVHGLWFMVYGLWFMVYGLWFMVYGLWFML